MTFKAAYRTPEGFSDLVMESDGEVLTGLRFDASGRGGVGRRDCADSNLPVFGEARRWLDAYFGGHEPDFTPAYRIDGMTSFRKDVIDAMLRIPFGGTTTYGEIAAEIARRRGLDRMSAQAVGGAVGWNPLCIIIPCHRVVGADGALVGYGGGIENKVALLAHESGCFFEMQAK